MDRLPELTLIAVFSDLPLYDQLRIRSVCKQWKVITEKRILCREELVLFYKTAARPLIWFHSDRPVNPLSVLSVNKKFKRNPDFYRLFERIKRLFLICRLKDLLKRNFIHFVNNDPHLKNLQVETLADPICGVRKLKIRLHLPNLKSFCLNTIGDIELLQLNCPKLEKLSAPFHFEVDEKYASFKESLKFLKVVSFQCKPGFELSNLETLFCQDVLPIDISSHKQLKEIHCIHEHWGFSRSSGPSVKLDVVLNGLFEQMRLLERNDLQIYSSGLRCSPENKMLHRIVTNRFQESDLTLILEFGDDLKLEHQRKELIYKWNSNGSDDFDGKLARIGAEQAEKLARCLVKVSLGETLAKEPALNFKFKILFRYVQVLWLWEDIQSQSDLDRLPEHFPHLVELVQTRSSGHGIYSVVRYPSLYPNDFTDGPLNFRFLSRFKNLQKLSTQHWKVSPSELKEMMKNCRFLEELQIHAAKLEKANGKIRTRLNQVELFVLENEFKMRFNESEYSVSDGETIRSQTLREKLYSLEETLDRIEQRGCLRREIR